MSLYSGWTARWAGLVLVGRGPDGREASIGEVLERPYSGPSAELVHPSSGRSHRRATADGRIQARQLVESWLTVEGGELEVAVGSGPPVTPEECRAWRAAKGWSKADLARALHAELLHDRDHNSISATISKHEAGYANSAPFLAALTTYIRRDGSPAQPSAVVEPGGGGGAVVTDPELEMALADRAEFVPAVEAAPVYNQYKQEPVDPRPDLYGRALEATIRLHDSEAKLAASLERERDLEVRLEVVSASLDRLRIPPGPLLWRLGNLEGRLGPDDQVRR